ncbi:GDP-mannose 4,6-dehydratase [Gracilibacillus suaedae]|uniref:GDP-mannose 4,6-dehydratase n=1 Tax=Gracilibacillus suaedae TaxID=2820273 RepID=UPI001ABE182F|nr:GDP-mannose 4,6-dehydratase [Gracilibacillus suaedae]
MSTQALRSDLIYLVTGAVGFIGYYLSKKLLDQGCTVIGIDNVNDYYDVNLKYTRLQGLEPYENFAFVKANISDKAVIDDLFAQYRPNVVVNLAAQTGVRYSLENPDIYMQSNVIGFYNILEACRHYPVDHFIYASSSSVYGANKKVPFEESDFVDHPVSLYASTKKSNELMAHTYSHLYKIPTTGLRFFTVYGPMGRPDMAYYDFTDKYFAGESIKIFNNGDFENDLYRDFTYIDDIVEGIVKVIPRTPEGDVQHEVFNIGNNNPEKLMHFITSLEKALSNALGKEVEFKKIYEPIKLGDVPRTYASTERLNQAVGFKPQTPIEEGLQKFADWYVQYHDLFKGKTLKQNN